LDIPQNYETALGNWKPIYASSVMVFFATRFVADWHFISYQQELFSSTMEFISYEAEFFSCPAENFSRR
jgi:hypothetical protein